MADQQARDAISRALKAKKEAAEAKARKANIGLWTAQLEEVRRQERVRIFIQILILNIKLSKFWKKRLVLSVSMWLLT